MKKLVYLFVMIAGMTLATANVKAEDKPKAKTECSKDCKKACCKDKAACSKKEADKK